MPSKTCFSAISLGKSIIPLRLYKSLRLNPQDSVGFFFLEARDPKDLRLPSKRGEFCCCCFCCFCCCCFCCCCFCCCCCCFSLVLCLKWSITLAKRVRMTPKFVWVILCINSVILLSHQSFESSWLLLWVIMTQFMTDAVKNFLQNLFLWLNSNIPKSPRAIESLWLLI